MKICGFRYDKETKIINGLVFYKENLEDGTIEYFNDEVSEKECVFKANIDKVGLIEEIINILNEPEELVYLESNTLDNSIYDILAKRIKYDSKGHLSNLLDSEVIDLEGLESINLDINLFNKIKNKPHKLVSLEIKDFYTSEDIDSFVEYDIIPVNEYDVRKILDENSKTLAKSKLENMKVNGINNKLAKEIAAMKIELMELKKGGN
ncbi:hypothetical protein SCB17_001933 [Clostridium perfringens]|nr:hypothetical protein [Clostridium perfringens]